MTAPARAQTGDNVLVIANERAPLSLRIAARYAAARHVPDDQILRVHTAPADEIPRREYANSIQAPIAKWLAAHKAQDRILYIVLTTGIPVRIAGTPGRSGTMASVDSELALLYRRMAGQPAPLVGWIPNPYFESSPAKPSPFSHKQYDIYLVTRLDGFSERDIDGLIDRGSASGTAGRILLDGTDAPKDPRNQMLESAAASLRALGFQDRTKLDLTSSVLQKETDVLGYFGSGSNDPALQGRAPALTFVPGAVGAMFLSTDARTFTEPPADWKPALNDRRAAYAGSSQSLVGDLVREGITGVAGQVAEPLLEGAIRPSSLFTAYVSGANLAEAFYQAIPFLSWQTVVVGDPLCAPFPRTSLSRPELDPPLDPDTELPSWFSAHRLAATTAHADARSIKLVLKGEARLQQSDAAGAQQALEQAVAIDPSYADAWVALGAIYQNRNDSAHAVDAYQHVIALEPKNALALNNLAYEIGVNQKKPQEALLFAQRAARLAPQEPRINDTLGWIKHLLGDENEAVRLLEIAAREAPDEVDVQLHVAAVYLAVGRANEASAALQRARDLDPEVQKRADFRELEQKLTGKSPPQSAF